MKLFCDPSFDSLSPVSCALDRDLGPMRRVPALRHSVFGALFIAVGSILSAQTYTGYVSVLGSTPDTVTGPGTVSASGSIPGFSAITAATLTGMTVRSTGSATSTGSSGTVIINTVAVSDQLGIYYPGHAGDQGIAVLRYDVGALTLTGSGSVASLTVTGNGGIYSADPGANAFPIGILELQFPFNFTSGSSNTNFNVGIGFDVQVQVDFSTNPSAGYDFGSGARFLGIASVRDVTTDELLSGYSIASGSGTNYNVSAIPEPSTYAAWTGVMVLTAGLVRRRCAGRVRDGQGFLKR